MNIQRLRNLTTGRLHTEIGHVYEDMERLIGVDGLFTHMLPNACRALQPYLREVAPDERLWDGKYDVTHIGEIDIPPMNEEQQKAFWARHEALPSPLATLGSQS